MPDSALFDKRVILETMPVEPDRNQYGEPTSDPVGIERWASIEQLTSEETERARKLDAEASHRLTLPWDPDVVGALRSNWRIRFGDRIFDVAGPPDNIDEQNFTVTVLCQEQVNG